MAYFAVLDNNVVINVIVVESLSIAEELTGATCVEFNPEDAICGIGSTWNGAEFTKSTLGAPPSGEASA